MTAVLFGAGVTLGVSALAIAVNKTLHALDNKEHRVKEEPTNNDNNYTGVYDDDEDFTL